MQFVYPGFLWALLLIGIPILIHLFNFRRYKKVAFSNVSMLKKVQTQSKKSRQLKRWLVLLCRILAVASLVLAFAQPYFNTESQTLKPQVQAIYIDNSYSMSALGEEGQLLELAKNKARTLVKAFGRNASFILLTNSYSSRPLSYDDILEQIDEVELSQEHNDYSKVLQYISQSESQEGNSYQTYLITDLQRQDDLVPLDSSASIKVVQLQAVEASNLSIDSVWLESPVNKYDESLEFKVKVSNHANTAVESNLFLHLNGQQRAALSIDLRKSSSQVFQMDVSNLRQDRLSGYFSVQDPGLPYDNQYYISLNLKSELSVLEIASEESPFALIFNDSYLSYERFNPASVDHSSLFSHDLIILHALDALSPALAKQLNEFVNSGGNVLFIPSDDLERSSSISRLLGLANYSRLIQQEISMDPDALKSAFYKGVYAELPDYMQMPKWSKYFAMSPSSTSKTLLYLKNKKAILLEHQKGKGRMFQMASNLNAETSNFAAHELFVISSLKMLFSSHNNDELAYALGRKEGIRVELENQSPPYVLNLEGQQHIVEHSSQRGLDRIWLNQEIVEDGVYVLEGQQDKDTISLLALNRNRAESSANYYTKTELEEAWGASVQKAKAGESQIVQLAKSADGFKALWKLFVLLCLIFLLLEILLLRFIKS